MYLIPIRHVRLNRDRVDLPARRDLLGPPLQWLQRPPDQRDVGTQPSEAVGDRMPQTITTSTGDERLLPGQIHQFGDTLVDYVGGQPIQIECLYGGLVVAQTRHR